MNFKSIVLILTLFFLNTGFSQQKVLHIEYDFYFKNYYPEGRQISLIANHKESLSTVTRTILFRSEPTSFYTHFFKTKDSIISKETLGKKEYFITEALNQFKWEITGNSKTFLGYSCQEATTTYRGRNYIAYFTTAVPFKAAPWKFNGLPGVMLAVKTDDEHIKIEPLSLEIESFSGDIGNPWPEVKNQITWEEFKDLNKKDWETFKHKVGSRLSLTRDNKELVGGKPRITPGLRLEIIVEGNGGYDQ